jgi:hypothetical protein
LALAFEVGETECDLPRPPGTVDGREAFPIIYLAREMLGREDSPLKSNKLIWLIKMLLQ